jgi:mitotic spindle assembly checkpoint protein MAD2
MMTNQLRQWLEQSQVDRLALVISSKDTREVLERWQFEIQVQDKFIKKLESEISKEIAALLRQITSSVTFLPIFNDSTTFNILAYTDKDTDVPIDWCDSDPRIIQNACVVKLRSFGTGVHNVDSVVCYKLDN